MFCILACSGCGLAYCGITAAAQSANVNKITFEFGVTTPEEVAAALGEPDREGPMSSTWCDYFMEYKLLFAWRSFEVTYRDGDNSRTYEFKHATNSDGLLRFVFNKGVAWFDKARIFSYQRAK